MNSGSRWSLWRCLFVKAPAKKQRGSAININISIFWCQSDPKWSTVDPPAIPFKENASILWDILGCCLHRGPSSPDLRKSLKIKYLAIFTGQAGSFPALTNCGPCERNGEIWWNGHHWPWNHEHLELQPKNGCMACQKKRVDSLMLVIQIQKYGGPLHPKNTSPNKSSMPSLG